MKMTEAHFKAIADTLKHVKPVDDPYRVPHCDDNVAQWCETVEEFANMCADSTPNFDSDQFLKACGYDTE